MPMSQSSALSLHHPQVEVIRSARRRKTLALRVKDGRVQVLAPVFVADAEIERLLQSRQAWLQQRLASPSMELAPAQGLPRQLHWFAEPYTLAWRPEPQPQWQPGYLLLPLQWRSWQALLPWLSTQAHQGLNKRVQYWAGQMAQQPQRVEVKAYRSRFGCCTRDGIIRLHWGLALAPLPVCDYVVIHELAHLTHFHHQPSFWQRVATFCPDWAEHRRWLRQHAQQLWLTGRPSAKEL